MFYFITKSLFLKQAKAKTWPFSLPRITVRREGVAGWALTANSNPRKKQNNPHDASRFARLRYFIPFEELDDRYTIKVIVAGRSTPF